MTKYVVYTETTADKRNVELKKWVGKSALELFPEQPVYVESALFNKRLVSEEDKGYILQNGDRVFTSVRPCGGGFFGGVVDLVKAASPTAILNPKNAFKNFNSGLRKVTRPLTNLFTPDINDPNFETDDRKSRPQITGASNSISNSVVPWVFGTTRMTPFYGQRTYSLVQDGSSLQKLYQYFICGYDNFLITQEKLGETPLSDYSTDSLERQFAFGTTANLSNPSVIETPKGEQLSYDKDKVVNQSSSLIYNQAVNNASLTYDVKLEFRNTVTTDWSTKTFRAEIDYYKNGDVNTLLTATHDFVVASGDLVLVSGKTYNYTSDFTETLAGADMFSTILETRLAPTGSTRNTSSEISQELECELDMEEVTCGAFNQTTELNNPINNYTGVVSAVVDTSKTNTKEIDVIFSFPQGLYKQNSTNGKTSRSAKVDIQIKDQVGEYQDIDQFNMFVRDENGNKRPLSETSTTVSGSEVTFVSPSDIETSDELFYRTIGVDVNPDKYTVRIRSADFSDKTSFDVGYPQVDFINYWLNENSVNSQMFPNVVQINLKATATKELSGSLQEYNFIGRGRANIWNGTDWGDVAFTSNPAAIIRYALLNKLVNVRAEDEEIIDNDSLVELYEYCESEGFEVNGVISQAYKVETFLDAILDACRSTWTFSSGKYYFATDKVKSVRQLFTQHNTYSFSSSPNIGKNVTALRMTYLDSVEWVDEEFTIYWYDGATHDTPKVNTTDADYQILKQNIDFITDIDIAKSIASYRLELIQAKRRNYRFSVNLEALDLKILDRILVSDTSNMNGSSTGQIKEIITFEVPLLDVNNDPVLDNQGQPIIQSFISGFKLYSRIDIQENSEIVIRSLNQVTEQIEINSYTVANSGFSDIIELSSSIPNNGVIQGKSIRNGLNKYTEWNYDGDLFEIGQGEILTCTVDGITFNEDLTATITAREA